MAVEEDNPFSKVYDKLWDLFDANPNITNLIPPGNRIKFDESPGQTGPKKSISHADVPELVILPESISADIKAASNLTVLIRDYSILLSTGDWNIDKYFNELSFEIFRSLTNWNSVLGGLTWRDKSFVKDIALLSVDEGSTESDQNRGIAGWASLWSIQVQMAFVTSDLQDIN